MKILKDRILKDGRCYPGGILKVDNFINHQMDPILMKSIGVDVLSDTLLERTLDLLQKLYTEEVHFNE